MSIYCRHPRVDANQAAIVQALRAIGCSVEPKLSEIGRGVPDLLVGFRGVNLVIEVKDGSKPPSKRQLTADEWRWHSEWRGSKAVVHDVNSAIKAVLDATSGTR